MTSTNDNKYFHNNDHKQWFALCIKPKQGFKARLQLSNLEIENYLPVIVKKSHWSDRVKEISEPVIRGYIFANTNESGRLKALEQFSICKCLFDQGKPAIIPEWQINNLKRFL